MAKLGHNRRNSSSSSSDDDEEKLQQLRESVVTLDSLKSAVKQETEAEKKISKRSDQESSHRVGQNEEYDSDDLNSFKPSPEFQQFVAKKLLKKLDESIEFVKSNIEKSKSIENEKEYELQVTKDRFISFKSVNQVNKVADKVSKKSKLIKKLKKESSSSSSDEDLEKFKEAAIDLNYLAKTTSIEKHKSAFSN